MLKPIEELTTIGELRSPELTTYDRRVEKARGDEYDRRMEYRGDLSVLCQIRKVSTAEDFELQVRRLDEMGKIIDTLTTMLTKPPSASGFCDRER